MTATLHELEPRKRVERWECHLPFPPSSNNLYENAGNGRRKASRYGNWITEAGKQLMILRPPRFLSPVAIEIQYQRPDKRKRDASNLIKAVEDLFVRHGVIQDDDDQLVPDIRSRVWGDAPKGQVKVIIERVAG